MRNFTHLVIFCFLFAILVGCNTSPSTDYPIITPRQVATLSTIPTKETQRLPTATHFLIATPNQTRTAIAQAFGSTQRAEQTLIAQFPRICGNAYAPPKFSPDKLWMEEWCYSEDDQNTILTLSNKDSQVLWKLIYRNYILSADSFPDGGLSVIHWTSDRRYAYFASYTGGHGGECFVGGKILNNGKGLFRFDLQTGDIKTMLPPQENFRSYDFSFSPTDRRLVYGSRLLGLVVLDIQTGQLIDVHPVSEYNTDGGYLWSLDGLEFLYSTVLYTDASEPISYSLRLVDAQTGSERILIESPENCFAARSWSDNNVLTIESYDKNYDRILVEYDLSSNKIISEVTATP